MCTYVLCDAVFQMGAEQKKIILIISIFNATEHIAITQRFRRHMDSLENITRNFTMKKFTKLIIFSLRI